MEPLPQHLFYHQQLYKPVLQTTKYLSPKGHQYGLHSRKHSMSNLSQTAVVQRKQPEASKQMHKSNHYSRAMMLGSPAGTRGIQARHTETYKSRSVMRSRMS